MRYKRGRNPNSLRNLKPQQPGAPSVNPCGRAGKGALTERALMGDDWMKWKAKVERDTKLVDRIFRKQFGTSLNEAWDHLRKRR